MDVYLLLVLSEGSEVDVTGQMLLKVVEPGGVAAWSERMTSALNSRTLLLNVPHVQNLPETRSPGHVEELCRGAAVMQADLRLTFLCSYCSLKGMLP